MSHNKKLPDIDLDDKIASQMLDNIFRSCSVTPSKVPLHRIRLWGKYKRTDFRLCQWITGIALVLLLMVPVLFVNSSLEMTPTTHPDGRSATLHFVVDSLLPVSDVQALLDGQALPLDNVERNGYSATVDKNGSLVVTVTLANGRSTSYDFQIDAVIADVEAPVVTHSSLNGGELTVFITDDRSEVALSGAYAVGVDGKMVLPISYDDATGAVVLPYNGSVLNLFVSDIHGNELHAIISPSSK